MKPTAEREWNHHWIFLLFHTAFTVLRCFIGKSCDVYSFLKKREVIDVFRSTFNVFLKHFSRPTDMNLVCDWFDWQIVWVPKWTIFFWQSNMLINNIIYNSHIYIFEYIFVFEMSSLFIYSFDCSTISCLVFNLFAYNNFIHSILSFSVYK